LVFLHVGTNTPGSEWLARRAERRASERAREAAPATA
jgi:hypothetical protein